MFKRYVYKNVSKRPINIGGYQFKEGQELESGVLISGFNKAVNNGFLELVELKPDAANQDATQAQQTGNTGKVKVIWHTGVGAEGGKYTKEIEVDPNVPIEFPSVDPWEGTTFKGWFKDAEFTRPVNVDKAKSPKEGERHFYAKIESLQEKGDISEKQPLDTRKTSNDEEAFSEVIPPATPSLTAEGEAAATGIENK
jgi:hypothetical protein